MKRSLGILFILNLLTTHIWAAPSPALPGAVVENSTTVKIVRSNMDINGVVSYLTGNLNPSSTPVLAAKGSVYASTLTGILYVKTDAGSTTNWNPTGQGITSVGTFGSSSNSAGATVIGNVLYMQPADVANPGGVSTIGQTFQGLKTMASGLTVGLATGSDDGVIKLQSSGTQGAGASPFIRGFDTANTEMFRLGFFNGTDNFFVTNYDPAGSVILQTNGSTGLTINSSQNVAIPHQLTVSNDAFFQSTIQNAGGSAGAPSYTFSGDTASGMYQTSTGNLYLAAAGIQQIRAFSTGLIFGNANTDNFTLQPDSIFMNSGAVSADAASINQGANNGSINYSGGNAPTNGGNLMAYGGVNGSKPNFLEMRAGSTVIAHSDGTNFISDTGTKITTSGTSLSLISGGGGAGNIHFVNPAASGHYNWQTGAQININNGFEITPSTATDGNTYNTPAVSVLPNGNVYAGNNLFAKGSLIQLNQTGVSASSNDILTGADDGSLIVGGGTSAGNGGIINLIGPSNASNANYTQFFNSGALSGYFTDTNDFHLQGILTARRDVNGPYRSIFTNGSAGASAYVELSLSAADDFNIASDGSGVSGPASYINAGAGFTGGLRFNISGANPMFFTSGGNQRLEIHGNGDFDLGANNNLYVPFGSTPAVGIGTSSPNISAVPSTWSDLTILSSGGAGTGAAQLEMGAGTASSTPGDYIATHRYYNGRGNLSAYVRITTGSNAAAANYLIETANSSGTLQQGLFINENGFQESSAAQEFTGAGSALLGSNSPASTLTAPHVWIKWISSDGSAVYIPAWK